MPFYGQKYKKNIQNAHLHGCISFPASIIVCSLWCIEIQEEPRVASETKKESKHILPSDDPRK